MLEQDKTFNNTLVIFTKFESVRITFMRNEKRWMQKFKNVCIKCT